MPYVTSIERHGIEKGKTETWLESIQIQLEHKFGEAGVALFPRVSMISDADQLKVLYKATIAAKSIDEVRTLLP